MAQHVDDLVTIGSDGSDRQTLVTNRALRLGQRVGGGVPDAGGGGSPLDRLREGVPPHAGPPLDKLAGPGADQPGAPEVFVNVGDTGAAGAIMVRDEDDAASITLDGRGWVTVGTGRGRAGAITVLSEQNGPTITIDGRTGRIELRDAQYKTTLVIDAIRGDIDLIGADCAEDFDVAGPVEAGSVMCIGEDGTLQPCGAAYDRRVVGVVSGAGDWFPGIRLDRRPSSKHRAPLALAGKVYCLVDATHGPIEMGDLLTTSPTSGHAMRASDPAQGFGAVLGKSLGSLPDGRGLVPALMALQ